MIKGSEKIVVSRNLNEKICVFHNKRKIVAGGCFDVLHFGHVSFLEKAKNLGEVLIILLEPDCYIVEKKKRHAIHTQRERAFILSKLEMVDMIVLVPEERDNEYYIDVLKTIKPSVIAVTEGDEHMEIKKKQAEEIGASVIPVTKYIKNFSSNVIISYENISCH